MMRLWRRAYGASPLHLLAHLAAFAVLAASVYWLRDQREPRNIALWFGAAIILHDALAVPLYSGLNALAQLVPRDERRMRRNINYVRIPVALSALLFVVFFPLITNRPIVQSSFSRNLATQPHGYLARYLVVVALLFAGSALALAWRLWRMRGAQPPAKGAGGW